MKVWTDDRVYALNPQEVAELFDLAPGAGASCPNSECVRSPGHRGRCADAEDFKRALRSVAGDERAEVEAKERDHADG